MGNLWQDVRYGARVLLKSPGLSAVAVLALALGVGANTAIFSLVNATLLRPLGYGQPERLMMVWEMNAKRGGEIPTSMPNFKDLRDNSQTFEGMAAFMDANFNLTGGAEPERVRGLRVSAPLLTMLGVQALHGRVFLPGEDEPAAPKVIVLGHGLWQRTFGADPRLIGRTVSLDGEVYTVVGVMPPGFKFPPQFSATIASSQYTMASAEFWVPLTPDAIPQTREARGLYMIGRLKPGADAPGAESDLNVVARRLQQDFPAADADMGVRVIPLQTQVTGDIRTALLVLSGAVGCVLLIACANVANLLLAKATARRKEMAVRLALGAGRARVVRQLLTESALLGLAGGAVGLLFAAACVNRIAALSPPSLARLKDVSLDWRVLVFTFAVSLLTSLLFGLAPALQATKTDLAESLREGGRGNSAGGRQHRLRALLVVSEVALALVLLIAAGLMLKSFVRLQNVNPGFDAENLLTLELQLPPTGYGEPAQRLAFQRRLVERVGAIPGVGRVATVDNLPFSGNETNNSVTIEGRAVSDPNERPRAFFRSVSPDYFQTMVIPVRSGRAFADSDNAEAPGAAILNEAAAQKFWPGENPLGKRFKRGRPESKNPWMTVVGVVGSVSHTSLELGAQPEVYTPFLQGPGPTVTLVARTASDPRGLTAAVRREVSALDAGLPVSNIKYMDEIVAASVAQPRLYALLIGVFAGLALALAAVGIYGVMSYSVVQRTHELGVRLALGAQPRAILWLVIRQGMALALAAIVVGLAASFALTRLTESLLYGVSASDPATFIGVPVLLALVMLVACYLPARRATKVDPLVAMGRE